MIEIQISNRYEFNRAHFHGDGLPCVVCGKGVNMKTVRYLHLHLGGSHAVTVREADDLSEEGRDNEDMGAYPIGACCLRKHPELKPYVEDAERPGKPDSNNAGLKSTRWNKTDHTWVSVYNAEEAQMDGKWMVVCEKHSAILSVDSLRLAKRHAAGDPYEFCEECREEALRKNIIAATHRDFKASTHV